MPLGPVASIRRAAAYLNNQLHPSGGSGAVSVVRAEYLLPAPDVTESEAGPEFTVAALDALVRMKLTSFLLKDKVHLLDLLDVGLIDETWCDRFPPALGARLRELLEARDRERT